MMQTTITGKLTSWAITLTPISHSCQYLTFNPAIRKNTHVAKCSEQRAAAQAGLPKGHVPFHTDDEFVSPYRSLSAAELWLWLIAGACADCPGCGGVEAVVAEFYAASSSVTPSTAATSCRLNRWSPM